MLVWSYAQGRMPRLSLSTKYCMPTYLKISKDNLMFWNSCTAMTRRANRNRVLNGPQTGCTIHKINNAVSWGHIVSVMRLHIRAGTKNRHTLYSLDLLVLLSSFTDKKKLQITTAATPNNISYAEKQKYLTEKK